uniref:DRBM domain-containing protein n=1 Tax=Glossina palpalis gambiensis TaxID=67801 RepID=A0A1B0AUC3_9MUSC
MNRPKRSIVGGNKPFVSGGVYHQNQTYPSAPTLRQQQVQQQISPQQAQTIKAQLSASSTQPHPQSQLQIHKPVKIEPVTPPRTQQQVGQHEAAIQHDIASQSVVAAGDDKGNNFCLDNGMVDENGKIRFKRLFLTRKKASVRAKEKRVLQNRRLRKTIIPKNALMALNEVKGITIGEFTITNNPNGGFVTVVTVNGNQYEGRGNSKMAAKNNACEKALRDYIIAKMRQNPRSTKHSGNMSTTSSLCNEPMDANDANESNEKVDGQNKEVDPVDDVPMVNLASFALYKLFSEWESEGFVIPEMHPSQGNTSDNEGSVVVKEPKKAPIRNELPTNWESMHPASLLCVMRPGITYTEKGKVGEKPNVMQSMGVVVDNQEFIAIGRSKKTARRNVAAVACNTLFGTNFAKEELVEL